MNTAQDKGQGLARITYFPQAFIQNYPNDQLRRAKILNIACPDNYSMSLTGIIVFSEIASIFCGKRKQASKKQKAVLSHTVKELVANHLLDPEATEKFWVVKKKKKFSSCSFASGKMKGK